MSTNSTPNLSSLSLNQDNTPELAVPPSLFPSSSSSSSSSSNKSEKKQLFTLNNYNIFQQYLNNAKFDETATEEEKNVVLAIINYVNIGN
jgi:hypothetical protein